VQVTQTMSRGGVKGQRLPRHKGVFGRSIRYLFHIGWQAWLPYIFLMVASLAQLAVPRLLRNIIDAVTQGVVAQQVLAGLAQIPETLMSQALPRLLEFLNFPASLTQEELAARLTAQQADAPSWRRVLVCVVEQVAEDLRQAVGVAVHLQRPCRHVHIELLQARGHRRPAGLRARHRRTCPR